MAEKRILADHKREGKKLIPPFTHMLGPMTDVSWVKTMLPELTWIAVIQEHSGLHIGVELITAVARAASGVHPLPVTRFFGYISAFEGWDSNAQEAVRSQLNASGQLSLIQESLLPLVALYPQCPLRFFVDVVEFTLEDRKQHLTWFKALMVDLYDKSLRKTVFVQSTFIWLAFDSGFLKVNKGLALAELPEVEHYPDTELSQKIAASICAALPAFFGGPLSPQSSIWPRYFWNRGLEIDTCCFEVQ
jgi:hypothetical protein